VQFGAGQGGARLLREQTEQQPLVCMRFLVRGDDHVARLPAHGPQGVRPRPRRGPRRDRPVRTVERDELLGDLGCGRRGAVGTVEPPPVGGQAARHNPAAAERRDHSQCQIEDPPVVPSVEHHHREDRGADHFGHSCPMQAEQGALDNEAAE
jgi:hypothetical protein